MGGDSVLSMKVGHSSAKLYTRLNIVGDYGESRCVNNLKKIVHQLTQNQVEVSPPFHERETESVLKERATALHAAQMVKRDGSS